MRRPAIWGVVLAVLGLSNSVLAQGFQPSLISNSADLARRAEVSVTAPLALYVSADGGDTAPCTVVQPCATIQHVCDIVPRDICDAVTITASADYTGTGCRKEGIRFCDHPAGDGGVTSGSLLVTGTLAAYAPADGGTGAGTMASAAAGSSCTLDSWTASGTAFNTNELQGKLIGITSGTGSGKDRLWPIYGNDAGVIQPESYGDATQPAASSGFQVYDSSGSSTINANLGQVVTKGGPAATQATNAAAFEFGVVSNGLHNGAGDDRPITIQHFAVSGGSTSLAIGSNLNVRENFCGGSTCWRGVPGSSNVALERNSVTAGIFAVSANSSIGGDIPLMQVFNNWATSSTTTAIRVESAATLYSRSNYFPNGLLRLSSARNGASLCDTYDTVRGGAAGLQDTNPGQMGGFPFDGARLPNNSAQAYTLSLSNGFGVAIDQNGSVFSTVNSANHIAAIAWGARILWHPSTTFGGGGSGDICPSQTIGCVTIAAIHARPQKSVSLDFDGSRAMESGGLIGVWEPLTVLGTGRDEQCGTSTFSGTSKAITFSTTFATAPDMCWCNDPAAAGCYADTATATTGGATFHGATNNGAFSWCCKATKN